MIKKLIIITLILLILTGCNSDSDDSETTPIDNNVDNTPITPTDNTPQDPEGEQKTYLIEIKNHFYPYYLEIETGSKVVWVNREDQTHSVVEDSGKFNSGDIKSSKVFTYIFNEPGTYTYHDGYTNKKATLIVS